MCSDVFRLVRLQRLCRFVQPTDKHIDARRYRQFRADVYRVLDAVIEVTRYEGGRTVGSKSVS